MAVLESVLLSSLCSEVVKSIGSFYFVQEHSPYDIDYIFNIDIVLFWFISYGSSSFISFLFMDGYFSIHGYLIDGKCRYLSLWLLIKTWNTRLEEVALIQRLSSSQRISRSVSPLEKDERLIFINTQNLNLIVSLPFWRFYFLVNWVKTINSKIQKYQSYW